MTNEKALKGRAKRKTITEALLLNLVKITDEKEEDERRQSYWNSYHFQRSIISAGGKLYGKYRKRAQHGKGRKLMGVKSVECNFNPGAKTYNPHIHLIVPDEATADILIEGWLHRLGPEFASPKRKAN